LFHIRKLSRKEIVIELTDNDLMDKINEKEYEADRGIFLDNIKNNGEISEERNKKNRYRVSGDRDGSLFSEEVKRVSFYLGKARKIFKNIENGTFP